MGLLSALSHVGQQRAALEHGATSKPRHGSVVGVSPAAAPLVWQGWARYGGAWYGAVWYGGFLFHGEKRMSTVQAERFPFDYDTMDKGDVIPAEKLEEITELSRKDKDYQLAILKVKGQITKELAIREKGIVVRCDHDCLRLLTDPEAAEYTRTRFKQELRALARVHMQAMQVDATKLDDDQKKSHERQLEVQGKYIQAMAKAKKEIRLTSHKRQTPGADTLAIEP